MMYSAYKLNSYIWMQIYSLLKGGREESKGGGVGDREHRKFLAQVHDRLMHTAFFFFFAGGGVMLYCMGCRMFLTRDLMSLL